MLIVEDDYAQSALIEEMLLEINPEVEIEWESNAKDAIDRIVTAKNNLEMKAFDLVICDVVLEDDTSGIDLLKYNQYSDNETKVILISAHSKKRLDKKYYYNFSKIDFLKKPLNFNLFYNKIAPEIMAS